MSNKHMHLENKKSAFVPYYAFSVAKALMLTDEYMREIIGLLRFDRQESVKSEKTCLLVYKKSIWSSKAKVVGEKYIDNK